MRQAYTHAPAITAYLRGQPVEGIEEVWTMLGVSYRSFIILITLHIILSIWAFILLLNNVDKLPMWGKVLAGSLLFLNLPIGTIAVVLILGEKI